MSDDYEKFNCAQREVAMRKQVYPGRVKNGLMSLATARKEIRLMEEIAEDYRKKFQPRLPLTQTESPKSPEPARPHIPAVKPTKSPPSD